MNGGDKRIAAQAVRYNRLSALPIKKNERQGCYTNVPTSTCDV